MPRRCNVGNCKSNYNNAPYTKIVSFPPKGTDEYFRWVDALPNGRQSILELKSINVCVRHFPEDVEWITIPGGKRPAVPPSIFPGVPSSCVKQVSSAKRITQAATSESRERRQKEQLELNDKIGDFETYCNEVKKRYKQYCVIQHDTDVYLSLTDNVGRQVIQFLHFRHVESHFGFLYLARVEKLGIEVPKSKFKLQKNSLLSKWSHLQFIFSVLKDFEAESSDCQKIALNALESMDEYHDSPHFQFIRTQLQLLLCKPKGRQYEKHLVVIAAELHNVSPAAYKMLRKSGALALPSIKLIKKMLSNTLQDTNLVKLFQRLKKFSKDWLTFFLTRLN